MVRYPRKVVEVEGSFLFSFFRPSSSSIEDVSSGLFLNRKGPNDLVQGGAIISFYRLVMAHPNYQARSISPSFCDFEVSPTWEWYVTTPMAS